MRSAPFLAAALLASTGLAGPAAAEPVLLISIDGLRPGDVIEAERRGLKIPNLRRFVTEGAYATGVTGVLPTVTYPSHVTLVTGASYMNHADSFGLVRGGHLDLCVLGGFQVAQNGDLANWSRSANDRAPAIGGAMDLAVGARRVWVVMEHTTKSGEKRILKHCTYPLTGPGCVKRVYTDLAVLDVTDRGFVVRDTVPGITLADLQALGDAELHAA